MRPLDSIAGEDSLKSERTTDAPTKARAPMHQLGLQAFRELRPQGLCLFCRRPNPKRTKGGTKRVICDAPNCRLEYLRYNQRDYRGSRSQNPHGLIYFVQTVDGGPIKIGFAHEKNLKDRLVTLQVFCPYDLKLLATIPGTMIDERRLHDRFRSIRMRGEWFKPDLELIAFIASHKPTKA